MGAANTNWGGGQSSQLESGLGVAACIMFTAFCARLLVTSDFLFGVSLTYTGQGNPSEHLFMRFKPHKDKDIGALNFIWVSA